MGSARRVVAVFLVLLAILLPLPMLDASGRGWGVLMRATAAAAAACANALGLDARVVGNVIHLSSRSLSIDPQCTAVTLLTVYVALVLAYPMRWKTRLLAIAVGLPVLVAVNIARLVGVAWVSERVAGKVFYMVHDYLFGFGMVFAVLLMWAAWLSYAERTG